MSDPDHDPRDLTALPPPPSADVTASAPAGADDVGPAGADDVGPAGADDVGPTGADDVSDDDLVGDEAVAAGAPAAPIGPTTVAIPQELATHRLDVALARQLPAFSRNRLQDLIAEGAVTTGDGRPVRLAKLRVEAGQRYTVDLPAVVEAAPEPQDIAVPIAYEDDHLLVIEKPAGLVVHPASGHADGTLVNALLFHCAGRLSSIGGVRRPGIVHRLDKDTSGLMVVAKTDQAHNYLKAQFQDRSLSRSYLAVVLGVPAPSEGRIEGAIGRKPNDRFRMAVLAEGRNAKEAATRYRVLEAFGMGFSLVECHLETGRTHQVRVHMAHLGHPLVGDPLYQFLPLTHLPPGLRGIAEAFPRQALHARTLTFRHPADGERRRFEMPPPPDMEALIDVLRETTRLAP